MRCVCVVEEVWRDGGAGREGTDRAGGFVDVSGAASGQGGQGGGVVYLSTEAWRRRRVGGEGGAARN